MPNAIIRPPLAGYEIMVHCAHLQQPLIIFWLARRGFVHAIYSYKMLLITIVASYPRLREIHPSRTWICSTGKIVTLVTLLQFATSAGSPSSCQGNSRSRWPLYSLWIITPYITMMHIPKHWWRQHKHALEYKAYKIIDAQLSDSKTQTRLSI